VGLKNASGSPISDERFALSLEDRIIRWKLRSWLLALVAATMLPCLAVLGWTFAANARRDKEEARREARVIATLIASRADQQLADARHLLETIARNSKVRTLRRDLCDAILPDFPLPNYAQIATINAAGETICSARPEPAGHTYKVRDWFHEAMSGRFAIGRPRVGLVSGRWIQPVSVPILGDTGKPAGVVLLAIDLLSFGSLLELGGENGVRASLKDLNGTMLARSADAENWVGRNLLEHEITRRALEGPSSSFEARDGSGTLRIYGIAPAAEGLWRVTVSFSEERVMAPLRRSRTQAAVLGILIAAAAIALSYWLTSRLARPIRGLSLAALGFRKLGAVHLAPVEGPAELRAAITHFNELVTARAEGERAMAESGARVAQLNRFLRTSWSVSQLIAREPDPTQMLAGACRILVESGGMRAAWVAFFGGAGEEPRSAASFGIDAAVLRRALGRPAASSEGLLRRVAASGLRQVVQDVERDEGLAAEEQARPLGIRSAAALPLLKWGKVAGVLVVYSGELAAFQPEVLALLEELVREIGQGLEHVDELVEHRNAELALQRSEAHLLVADRLASLGRLAAGVAHEINNPLAYVGSNVSYAIEELKRALAPGCSEEARSAMLLRATEALQEARHGSERVRVIVQDLKALSRSDSGPPGPVDLGRIIESSIKIATNEIRHRAELVKEIEPDLPSVSGSAARLGQVFLNLLINAAQAIEPGAAGRNQIRVRARRCGARAVIEVSDTGAGIAKEIQERIFEPFFTTKAVGVGTGLGLAICHSIVTQMGGELTVESEPGQGSLFRVALPLGEEAPEAAAVQTGSAPAAAAARRRRLLVIDDEAIFGRSIERILGDEHDVVLLTSPRAALDRLRGGERFDLILCDVMMPEMSGIEFHAELERVEPRLRREMIFMTGGVFSEGTQRLLDDVPNRRLFKPFDIERLREMIRA
jgi:signal transduction histidine kinase